MPVLLRIITSPIADAATTAVVGNSGTAVVPVITIEACSVGLIPVNGM
jgi:hypothetical protein